MYLNAEQKSFIALVTSRDGNVADEAVRDVFPRPPRFVIDVFNLTGRDLDPDGGWRRALADHGYDAEYDFLNAVWQIAPLGCRRECLGI